jgi:hypothetical protein
MRTRWLGTLLGLGLALCGTGVQAQTTAEPEAAKKPVLVMVGSTQCFYLRAADGTMTAQQRSDRIMDVFNKYLGGSKATFAVKPVGSKTCIFMNGEMTLAVTPEDVKAAKAKSVAVLAAAWKGALVKAFNETKAIK